MPALRNRLSLNRYIGGAPDAPRFSVRATVRVGAVLSFALCGIVFAAPQTPVKWVDSGGRVHYSDRKPIPDTMGRVVDTQAIPARAPAPSIGDPTLPWALRSAVARYPVTLYTATQCEPCEIARTHLAQRGVPYTEKRVTDADDLQRFHAIGFDKPLFPSVSIGPEKLVGYESSGWDRALDATGYPKSSMLPAQRKAQTIAPMRNEAPPQAEPAGNEAALDAGTTRSDVDSLLSPSSFHTGPNPIRF